MVADTFAMVSQFMPRVLIDTTRPDGSRGNCTDERKTWCVASSGVTLYYNVLVDSLRMTRQATTVIILTNYRINLIAVH